MENILQYMHALKQCTLFKGCTEDEISVAAACLKKHQRSCLAGECLYREGDFISDICILLSGHLHFVKTDYLGNANILINCDPGDLIGHAFACSQQVLTDNIICVQDAELFYIDYQRLLEPCKPSTCDVHTKMLSNLVGELANVSVLYHNKSLILAERSTRSKLMSFFNYFSIVSQSAELHLPFNRQELSDFLAVERSAMCVEMSRMRDDGLIDYHKNTIWLKEKDMDMEARLKKKRKP